MAPENNTSPENQVARDSATVLEELKQKVSAELKKTTDEAQEKSKIEAETKKYLDEEPKNKKTDPGTVEQQTRLQSLKKIINDSDSTQRPPEKQAKPKEIITATKHAAAEISNSQGLPVHDQSFFLGLTKINISSEQSLPFARLLTRISIPDQRINNEISEAVRKARIIFQIVVGESGNSPESRELLANILEVLIETHCFSNYAAVAEEIEPLFNSYEIRDKEKEKVIKKISKQEKENYSYEELEDARIKLINLGRTPEQKRYIEIYLSYFTPEMVIDLLKEQKTAESIFNKQLEQKIEPGKNLRQKLTEIGLNNEQIEELKSAYKQYLDIIKDDLSRKRNMILPRSFGFTRDDPYTSKIRDLDNSYVALHLMFETQNPFYFREYLKSKILKIIQHHPSLLNSQDSQIIIGINELKEEVFEDVNEMFELGAHSAHGNNPLATFYDSFVNRFNAIHYDPILNDNPIVINGKEVLYEVKTPNQENVGGMTIYGHNANNVWSIESAYSFYIGRNTKVRHLHEQMNSFVESVDKGKIESIVESSAINNEDLEIILNESPILRFAMQLYINKVKSIIAMNGGKLKDDMFRGKESGANNIDIEVNLMLGAAYPKLTDAQKNEYINTGKGLALITGILLQVFMDALPDVEEKIEKVPENLQRKIKNGEVLTKTELKQIKTTVVSLPHDFPFRSLLNEINWYKFISFWGIPEEDYNVNILPFVPIIPGRGTFTPGEMFTVGQKIKQAIVFGCNDETAQYMGTDEKGQKIYIPLIDIGSIIPNLNMDKRGGWRSAMYEFKGSLFVYDNNGRINMSESLQKILIEHGPTAAYNFVITPPDFENDLPKNPEESKKTKDKLIRLILENCYHYHPTLFNSIEKRRLFRRNEFTFNELAENYIYDNLADFSKFLSRNEEANEGAEDRPNRVGAKTESQLLKSREISKRLMNLMQVCETYASSHKSEGADLEIIFNNPEFQDVNKNPSEIADKNVKGIRTSIAKYIMYNHTYDASHGSTEELLELFIRYAKKVYYSENSFFKEARFLGINQGKDSDIQNGVYTGNGKTILDYYSQLINADILSNPFDWTYLDTANVDMQGLGIKTLARNASDFKTYLDYAGMWKAIYQKHVELISKGDKKSTIEGLKGLIDEIGKKVGALKPIYGRKQADKAGWLAFQYAVAPFVGSRAGDFPFFKQMLKLGSFGALEIYSYATLMNDDHPWNDNVLNMQERKYLVDHATHKSSNERVFSPFPENEIVTGVKEKIEFPFKVPKKINGEIERDASGKAIMVPFELEIPKWLSKYFPQRGKKKYLEGEFKNFTQETMIKSMRLEPWWQATNIISTVLIVGTIFVTFQAIREGMKAAEIK